jgi:hypothetical protein
MKSRTARSYRSSFSCNAGWSAANCPPPAAVPGGGQWNFDETGTALLIAVPPQIVHLHTLLETSVYLAVCARTTE